MIFVVSVLFFGFGIGALLFYSGNRSHRVNQLDNYAGGHFLSSDTRYHYSADFYAGLMHLIGSWYRGSFNWMERGVVMVQSLLSSWCSLFYRSLNPTLYLLATAVILLYSVVQA
jgi:NADH-quinone oxidoreductase subunit M